MLCRPVRPSPAQPAGGAGRLRLRPACAAAPGNGGPSLEEELATKLAAAEGEAARLRAQLGTSAGEGGELSRRRPAPLASGLRTDSQTARLGGVDNVKSGGAFLTEGELTGFLAKLGPGEADAEGDSTPEESGELSRRLMLGAAAVAAFAAFALVPDSALYGTDSRPLFLLLVPLVRAENALPLLKPLLENADWAELASTRRSQLPAGALREALEAAATALPSARAETARALATSFLEDLAQTDFAAYFDSRVTPTGAQAAEFASFGLRALASSQTKLASVLALFPGEDVQAARDSIAASGAGFGQ